MSRRDSIVETRRAREFLDELMRRARIWMPDWELDEDSADFGRALLQVAARFDAEVAERLARIPEKNARGLLAWLGLKGAAARAARMPVVFRLGARALAPVLARAPVKLQAAVDDAAIVFETEADIQLSPGQLRSIVAVDTSADAFYLPPPGLAEVEPGPGLPDQWRIKSFAAGGARHLQLEPALGLAPELIVEAGGAQYRITEVNSDIVAIDPALETDRSLAAKTVVNKVSGFVPFGGTARNRQQHLLYLGDTELLDLEAGATIAVSGLAALPNGLAWEYWGKREKDDPASWLALETSPVRDDGKVLLHKEKGSVELLKVGAVESRWIRARIATVDAQTPSVERVALEINPGSPTDACPFDDCDRQSAPRLEGVANTTPLVLDQSFYPFGQEPRQFDAFYLGCAEAFSKKGALVDLCFQVASPNLGPLGVLRNGELAAQVMAGVGEDRLLYLLQLNQADGKVSSYAKRKPLQPPVPLLGEDGGSQARIPLDSAPAWRPAMWAQDKSFFAAVAAGTDVWVWHEILGNASGSGWTSHGQVDPADTTSRIGGIVFVGGTDPRLVALYGSRLFESRIGSSQWQQLKIEGLDKETWAALAPVWPGDGDAVELLALTRIGVARRIWRDNDAWHSEELKAKGYATGVQPLAWRDGSGALTVVGTNQAGTALKVLHGGRIFEPPLKLEQTLTLAGSVLDSFTDSEGKRHVVLLAKEDHGEPIVLAWGPVGADGVLYEIAVPPSVGAFRQAGPAVAGKWLALPGANGDLLVGPARKERVLSFVLDPDRDVTDALLDAVTQVAEDDLVRRSTETGVESLRKIDSVEHDENNRTIYPLERPFSKKDGKLLVYRRADERHASITPTTDNAQHRVVLALDHKDERLSAGQWLLLRLGADENLYEIEKVSKKAPYHVTLKNGPPDDGGRVAYWAQEALKAEVAPLVRLSPDYTPYWTRDRLRNAWFSFSGLLPRRQKAVASVQRDDGSALFAFAGPWKTAPTSATAASASEEEWSRHLGDTSSNPELSWEYWNGTGWWTIAKVNDRTARLRKNGMLSLTVPDDLQATDWGGKTNFWIRARLVGGDYGREKLTVIQTEEERKTTKQTIDRNTDDIRAPLVVKLQLRYRVQPPALPTWLLTQDSGSLRDQSDANRTEGATVDLFVPLGVALAGLESRAVPLAQSPTPHCGCGGSAEAAVDAADAEALPAPGRALYLGFDARLEGGPLRLLFKAGAEHDHDAYAPLRVEAVDAGRAVPVTATDDTRGLGETGLLSFTLAAPPQATDLFGAGLYWMRLRPALAPGASDQDWQPDIRGLYFNAVWAQAAETQEFEMLASSDGAPNQVVYLARPPMLENTLELRVREPLGDEEREQLWQSGANAVKSAVPDQPGDWVLWRQVGDPADSGPGERVYALDAATGEIRFGDGRHGAIVPIGRDAVMAFRYQRTEAAAGIAPANGVTDGSSLTVVTPVESVEAVFAAGQAAGGAPPEDTARVLRFGAARLRHRGRLVTAADLEEMAKQIAPEVAQARCLRGAGGIRLVIVMRGSQPAATRAQKRELRRALLAAASPALARKGALTLVDPVPRPISVRLVLAIASLDNSGQVAQGASAAIRALFDAATGGADGQGWRLGETPVASDIAACLLDLPHLDSIVALELADSGGPLRPHELAVADGIDLHILTQETVP